MLRYVFTARWIPGKQNIEADALSRSPVDRPTTEDEIGEGPHAFIPKKAIVGLINGSTDKSIDSVLETVKAAAAIDPIFKDLRKVILEGFPNEKRFVPASISPFWDMRHQLAIDDNDEMIVCGARVVIPRALVPKMLDILSRMHQGASKMRQRARLSVYWPGMDTTSVMQPLTVRAASAAFLHHRQSPSALTRKLQDRFSKSMATLVKTTAVSSSPSLTHFLVGLI